MIIPEPRIETIRGEMRVRLIEDWRIVLKCGLVLIVPKGFETDFASVPRWLWPVMSPMGDLRYGGIIHDFGYQHGYLLSPYSPAQVYNLASCHLRAKRPDEFNENIPVFAGKEQAFFDWMLKYVTICATGKAIKANAAYLALRLFGWIVWRKYRKRGPSAFNRNSLDLSGV